MKERLLQIRESIQPFAPWNVSSLQGAFADYKEVLLTVAGPAQNRPDLEFLVINLMILQQCLGDAQERMVSEPYDFASNKLRCDIELLLDAV
jgi:hypothetical protein